MLRSRIAQRSDLDILTTFLRDADRVELQTASGQPPEVALYDGYLNTACWTVLNEDDVPIAIYGVGPGMIPDHSSVWMVATTALPRYRVPFLKQSRTTVRELVEQCGPLHNFVDARNKLHIRWLLWVGAVFTGRVELIDGHAFKEFIIV